MTPRKPDDFSHFCSLPNAAVRFGNATTGDGFVSRGEFLSSSLMVSSFVALRFGGVRWVQYRGRRPRAPQKSKDSFCKLDLMTAKHLQNKEQNLSDRSRTSTASASILLIWREWLFRKRPMPTWRFSPLSMFAPFDGGLLMTPNRRQTCSASSSPRLCGGFTSADRSAA